MQERLVRFGFSGLVFLGCTIFFVWYFGVDISQLVSLPNENAMTSVLTAPLIIGIITLLIGTPAIGFCLSTITAFIFLRWWSTIGFYRVSGDYKQKYYALLFESLGSDVSGIKYHQDENEYIVKNTGKNAAYISHDVLFRRLADSESLKYTARRLDMFWTHLNNLSCILWSLFFAILVALQNDGFQGSIIPAKALMIVPILAYLISGCLLARRDLIDSTEFEKIFLLEHSRLTALISPEDKRRIKKKKKSK